MKKILVDLSEFGPDPEHPLKRARAVALTPEEEAARMIEITEATTRRTQKEADKLTKQQEHDEKKDALDAVLEGAPDDDPRLVKYRGG